MIRGAITFLIILKFLMQLKCYNICKYNRLVTNLDNRYWLKIDKKMKIILINIQTNKQNRIYKKKDFNKNETLFKYFLQLGDFSYII